MSNIPQLPITQELLKEWIAALRSTTFIQTRSTLREYNRNTQQYEYCALGILGMITGCGKNGFFNYPDLHVHACYDVSVPWNHFEDMIEEWNDIELYSFEEIAELLEEKYLNENKNHLENLETGKDE